MKTEQCLYNIYIYIMGLKCQHHPSFNHGPESRSIFLTSVEVWPWQTNLHKTLIKVPMVKFFPLQLFFLLTADFFQLQFFFSLRIFPTSVFFSLRIFSHFSFFSHCGFFPTADFFQVQLCVSSLMEVLCQRLLRR